MNISLPPREHRQRVVRVFVSSTFRDMQDERDELVLKIFPELRKRCRERQVEFVEVDLRWGITEAQSQRGEVLPICLAEIERCRPYFICILGERYGWIPDSIDPELIQRQEWLEEHQEKSVTELEILHGVLRNPSMAGRSYFYFRDPAYLDKVPADQRAYFQSEDSASPRKLEDLKQRIRESGFPLEENYPDPEALGQHILDDLWEAIDQEFPAGATLDPLDQEAIEHEAFAQSRARVYIGREEYFKRLDDHVNGDGPPLVLVGESGIGKSALLACWAQRHVKGHPEDFMILHFIGSSSGSADYRAVIRRIMGEIKRRYQLDLEIPTTQDKLREDLPVWLASASAKRKMILILDALNQLEDIDNAGYLGWLPNYFPPNIRLIVSSIDGSSMDALEKRKWPQYEVHGLRPDERLVLIDEYLGLYRKTLAHSQSQLVVSAPQTSNPLFLKALLNELRVFGIHEKLDDKIRHYLQARTVPDLYEKILERLEHDYERDYEDLVGDSLSFIWASRKGLYESELLELLGDSDRPISRMIWSPLYLALEDSLVNRSGLLNFFHDYLRQAVERRYVTTPKAQRNWHTWLGDFFERRDLNDRMAYELPWQRYKSLDWAGMESCLTNLDLFHILLVPARRYEILGYWRILEREGFDILSSYRSALEAYENLNPTLDHLAGPMEDVAFWYRLNARYSEAEPLCRRVKEISEQTFGWTHPMTAQCLLNLGSVLMRMGKDKKNREALSVCSEATRIYEKTGAGESLELAHCLELLGEAFLANHDLVNQKWATNRAVEIYKRMLGVSHPITIAAQDRQAWVLYCWMEFADAENLYRHVLENQEEVLGPVHPETAATLHCLSLVLYTTGEYLRAEPMCERALEIYMRFFGTWHDYTASVLNTLGALRHVNGDYDVAESLYRKALKIYERTRGDLDWATIGGLEALGLLMKTRGDYEEATVLLRRALDIRMMVDEVRSKGLIPALVNLAKALLGQGDHVEAEQILTQAKESWERERAKVLYEQENGMECPDIAGLLLDLSELYKIRGNDEGSEALISRVRDAYSKGLVLWNPESDEYFGGPSAIKRPLRADEKWFSELYDRQGNRILDRVRNWFPELMSGGYSGLAIAKSSIVNFVGIQTVGMLEIYERSLPPVHYGRVKALSKLAWTLYQNGDFDRAEPLFRRACEIREQVLGVGHPETIAWLEGLAHIMMHQGRYDSSERLFERVLEIKERILGPGHPSVVSALRNLGSVLNLKGDFEAAKPLLIRARETREKLLDPVEHDYTSDKNVETVIVLCRMANKLFSSGACDEAGVLSKIALEIAEEVLETGNSFVPIFLDALAHLPRGSECYNNEATESSPIDDILVESKEISEHSERTLM